MRFQREDYDDEPSLREVPPPRVQGKGAEYRAGPLTTSKRRCLKHAHNIPCILYTSKYCFCLPGCVVSLGPFKVDGVNLVYTPGRFNRFQSFMTRVEPNVHSWPLKVNFNGHYPSFEAMSSCLW